MQMTNPGGLPALQIYCREHAVKNRGVLSVRLEPASNAAIVSGPHNLLGCRTRIPLQFSQCQVRSPLTVMPQLFEDSSRRYGQKRLVFSTACSRSRFAAAGSSWIKSSASSCCVRAARKRATSEQSMDLIHRRTMHDRLGSANRIGRFAAIFALGVYGYPQGSTFWQVIPSRSGRQSRHVCGSSLSTCPDCSLDSTSISLEFRSMRRLATAAAP